MPDALFIVALDYALRKAVNTNDGLTLRRRQSSRHPAVVLPDLDFADDICLLEDTIRAAQDFLHRVESATQEIDLFLNASKTMVMHINPPDPLVLKARDGTVIEQVSDFKYLGSLSNTAYDVSHRIGLAWGASHSLRKSHTTNTQLYNGLPRITRVIRDRRLALAGHVMRHDEMAGRVLLWRPDDKRRRGRPSLTLKRVIEEDVGLQDGDLLSVMRDRAAWRNFTVSPDG
uniref:Reverse transcriptase domain-containing protein n=1 Tax=Branchiostoma floridae TaxID=7739 RepID=C3XZ91_BRAFL|eukprot:XP_002610645.1 hypothetical protein BRAFLDRAFT_65836 [Branchiostoma floridae]